MALSRGLLVSVALLASLAMAAAANSTCANDALGGLLSVNGQGTVSLPPNMATVRHDARQAQRHPTCHPLGP